MMSLRMRLHALSFLPADYVESSLIDCDSLMEVDGGWMLSGLHRLPAPHMSIVTASVPSDGDYSLYLKAGEDIRYNRYDVTVMMSLMMSL